jgi:hypothetical protein
MWQLRKFRSHEAMQQFLTQQAGKIQFVEVFINNAYGIEYRKLRQI